MNKTLIKQYDKAMNIGLKTVRMFAHSDGGGGGDGGTGSALLTKPGEYNEETFVGLDIAIHEASQRGIRVTLALLNNWGDYDSKSAVRSLPLCKYRQRGRLVPLH